MAEINNQSDFDRIQQEIMNRSRQMYRNAPKTSNQPQARKHDTNKPDQLKNPPESNVHTKNAVDEKDTQSDKTAFSTNFMDMIMADKERSLIILLIILLSEEHVDSTVILALMYLII